MDETTRKFQLLMKPPFQGQKPNPANRPGDSRRGLEGWGICLLGGDPSFGAWCFS